MKTILKKLTKYYNQFDHWFEKQFGWFFTNSTKAELARKDYDN